jgi:hypothetical protein
MIILIVVVVVACLLMINSRLNRTGPFWFTRSCPHCSHRIGMKQERCTWCSQVSPVYRWRWEK